MKEKKVSAKVGRPSIYDKDKHPKEYVEFCKLGYTKAKICGEWGISRETLHKWSTTIDEFIDAVKIGDPLRIVWWSELGMDNLNAEKFNATTYIWLTKNLIGWTDKIETKNDTKIDAKVELSEKADSQLMDAILHLEMMKAQK